MPAAFLPRVHKPAEAVAVATWWAVDLAEAIWVALAEATWADLTEAALPFADLRGADLRGAHLNRAYLTGAVLLNAQIEGAIFEQTDMLAAVVSEGHLSPIQMQQSCRHAADPRPP